uniref:Protein arginine methyltransferase NDUFAF7 n=1 Tax=Parastrongyloides trichosuri TaxID=131310 RepID=A0A0N4ZUV4_PARTI
MIRLFVKPCLKQLRPLSSSIPIIGNNKSNALKKFIQDKIKVSGPITVHEYMQIAIGSSLGYYSNFNKENFKIFGDKGDFITAPEICQIFGESIAIWIYSELSYTGWKNDWQLVECGPGSGQLTKDILQSLRKFDSLKNTSIHLVEISNALSEVQEKNLCGSNSNIVNDKPYYRHNKTFDGIDVFWYKLIDYIPEKFSIFIANEFLDALPIHQFERGTNEKFHEIYVNLDNNNELVFMKSKGGNINTEGLIPDYVKKDKTIQKYEISPEAGTFVTQITERIIYYGGFGLLIDYGHDGERKTFSLRGYKDHKEVENLLENPGEIDITADVNFDYLKNIIKNDSLVFGPITQREFVLNLGGAIRLKMLLRSLSGDEEKQKQLFDAFNILVGENDNMGMKFKLLSIFPSTLKNIIEKRGGYPLAFNVKK